jgi:amino acid adenylation domain-containing protein
VTDGKTPRRERILSELKDLMQQLGGLEPDQLDVQATFLELGFDSLFLAQASTAFTKKFGVKIAFRQLLEAAPTLDALAGFINSQLPEEKEPPPTELRVIAATREFPVSAAVQQPEPVNLPLPLQVAQTSSEVDLSGYSYAIENIISQQLHLMGKQLEVLRNGHEIKDVTSDTSSVLPHHGNAHYQSSSDGVKVVENQTSGSTSAPRDGQASMGGVQRFGPWKPIDKSSVGGLDARQKKYLDDLILRYTRRTRRSKELTQAHRFHLADPRAVAGFRAAWKEMVYPIVVERSSGSKLWDVDGNQYIDMTMGFGSILLGHSPQFVTEALQAQIEKGIEIGPQSPLAGEIAKLISDITGMERVAYCNTGSEAVLAALRVARTVTGRNKIAIFAGSYHGVFDEVLVRGTSSGKKLRTMPVAPGIPPQMVENVVLLEYGNAESFEVLKDHAEDLAAVLVEPVQSRHPDLQPREFLHELRQWTQKAEVALIFDEVITGFRLHPGGAQAWFGVQADLATYGKIVGGGMPIGILAGKANFMDALDGGMWNYGDDSLPEAAVTYFAGTFVRHPLALAAASSVLNHLKQQGPELQRTLNERAARLTKDINEHFRTKGVPIRLENCASMFHFSFLEENPLSNLFFFYLREKGLHIWEGRPTSISTAHTDSDLAFITRAIKESVAEMQEAGFFPPSPTDPKPILTESHSPLNGKIPPHGAFANGTSGSAALAKKNALLREFPLTESQMEIWLATRFGDNASQAFNENILLRVTGKLDLDAMCAAIQQVVNRHEALRTTFSVDGSYQRVFPSLHMDVPCLDFSHLAGESQEAQLDDLLKGRFQQPFDLVNGPLVRARLLKLNDEEHLVLLTAHHLVCDGWSIHVILQELSSLYTAVCQGATTELPAPMQFREYSRWEWEQQHGPAGLKTEQFWVEQFSGSVPVLELPTDRPRPHFQTFRGGQQRVIIDDALYAGMKHLGSRNGCTAFTSFMAAYNVLLHRLTAQNDIVVGVGMAGQSLIGEDVLVGHCVNTLPLRSRIDGRESFSEYLKALNRKFMDAFEHSNFTFGSLLRADYPKDKCIHELFEDQVERTPDAVAVVFEDQQFTYGELNTRANQLAHYLRKLGVGPEVLVGICLERSIEMIVGLLGILKAGGAYVPLDPSYPQERRQFIVNDTSISVLLTRRAWREQGESKIDDGDHHGVPDPRIKQVCLDRDRSVIDQESRENLTAVVQPRDLAYVIYTSGSTGTPKGVAIEHRQTVAFLSWVRSAFTQDELRGVLASTSICFDLSVFEIFAPLSSGGTVIVAQNALALTNLPKPSTLTLVNTVPSAMDELLNLAAIPKSVRVINLAGEPLRADLVRRIYESSSVAKVHDLYGPSECTTYSTWTGRTPDGPQTIGRPIANTQIYILDGSLNPVPIGIVGEIYIGGDGVARGYLNRPELTAEKFIPNPIQSRSG